MDRERQRLLFVCSRNRWRSPTAERIFSRSASFAVRSRGLSASAARRLSGRDVEWADVVFVMESEHKRRLVSTHREAARQKPIYVLDIEDEYEFMDPELVDRLRDGVESILGPVG